MCEKLSSSSASSIDNDSCAKYRVFMDLEAAASQCAVLGTVVPAENEKSPAPWGQIRTLKLNAQILESGGALDGCHLACRASLISYKRPSVRIGLPIIL